MCAEVHFGTSIIGPVPSPQPRVCRQLGHTAHDMGVGLESHPRLWQHRCVPVHGIGGGAKWRLCLWVRGAAGPASGASECLRLSDPTLRLLQRLSWVMVGHAWPASRAVGFCLRSPLCAPLDTGTRVLHAAVVVRQ